MDPRHLTFAVALLFGSHAQAFKASPSVRPFGEEVRSDWKSGARGTDIDGFEENKGQVRTVDGQHAPYVRFRLVKNGASIFLLNNGVAYQFEKYHYPEAYLALIAESPRDPRKSHELDALRSQVRLETYRMDMMLEGASSEALVTMEDASSDYTNYYNYDALDVHHYGRVTYHDVYPGIDWVVYTTDQGMKYDFDVHPGADPSQIKMRFDHAEELYMDASGALIHGNRMGRFTEQPPMSFQEGSAVDTRFVLKDRMIGFEVGAFDHTRDLIIDPARIWGTYYGGAGDELAVKCEVDGNGDVYVVGPTFSSNAIASGGYQNTYGGNEDAFLVKFNAAGVRQWASFYGGALVDSGEAMALDGSGNVFIGGMTNSTANIASGGHQMVLGGGADAFLVKFSGSGARLWATYYGGSAEDRAYSIATDASGNVFMCGTTLSSNAMASGGHQNTPGGSGESYLVKFDGGGVRLWGTYYGGTVDDAAYGVGVDPFDNVIMVGTTNSATGSAIADGGFQMSLGGGMDGYIVKFTANGTRLWGTYYGGAGTEQAYSCVADNDGNILFVGTTNSTTGIASAGSHQGSMGGVQDGYIVKLSGTGQRIWATYYGGTASDAGLECAVDQNGNVYASGYTRSSNDIAANGFQNTYAGSGQNDAYLVMFSDGGVRQWGTYYGDIGADAGVGCAVTPAGECYLCGATTSVTSIASGGHQNTYGGATVGSWGDGFLVKFEGAPQIVTGTVLGAPFCGGASVAVPYTISGTFNSGNVFSAQLSDAVGSFGSPVDIGSVSATVSGAISCIIPVGAATGTGYRIRVVGSDPPVVGIENGVDLSITAPTMWYADVDADGYGDAAVTTLACSQPGGYVITSGDGCPNDPNKIAPGVCGCGVADLLTTWYLDGDNDGFGDQNSAISGYACSQPVGYVANSTDCDDSSALIYVGASCDDGNAMTATDVINTSCACAGQPDLDGDGVPDVIDPCPLQAGFVPGAGCDDADPNTYNDVIVAFGINCVCQGTISTGVETAEDIGLTVAPNPTTGLVRITLPAQMRVADLLLTDAMGRVVLKERVAFPNGTLDLSLFAKGLYRMAFVTNDRTVSIPVVLE